jgi:hypothetical protein
MSHSGAIGVLGIRDKKTRVGLTMKRTLIALAAIFALGNTGVVAAAEPNGVKYAVLVGVTEYEHPRFNLLKFAENDVAELGQKLRSGGFRVIQLSQSIGAKDARLKPSRANILREMDAVLNAATKHDLVLVALSGHGLQPSGSKENFFCPADARPQDFDTLIGMSDLYKRLDNSAAAVKLLLADACRDDPVAGKGITTVPLPPPGVGVLLSCSPGEQAYEHKSLKHGVFFHYLLEGLNGKGNDDGEITFNQLADYVQRKVSRAVPTLIGDGAKQSPNLVVNISGESPVLLKCDPKPSVANGVAHQTDNLGNAKPMAIALPSGKDLVGDWSIESGITIHFKADGRFSVWLDPLLYVGKFSCADGLLKVTFDVGWEWLANVTWVDQAKTGIIMQVKQNTMPNGAVGESKWMRTTKTEPILPSAKELIGKWTMAGGSVFTFGSNGNLVIESNGASSNAEYLATGNRITIGDANAKFTGTMSWADPSKKTVMRITVDTTNIPNQKEGNVIEFTRGQ